MRQEALLPDTKAIPRGTLEFQTYRNGWLVRLKRLDGTVRQAQFKDPDAAFEQFEKWREELR